MKTGAVILAGLVSGVVVAVGILAAFVFVGPDPVGLRPTPPPTPIVPSPSLAPSPASSPSAAPSASAGPGGSASAGASGGTAFRIGQPAPALSVSQLGGGTIDLGSLRGKAVWLDFMQTTSPESADELRLMNGFLARYEQVGLVVIAVDVGEDESRVTSFVLPLNPRFPVGLDPDGAAQRTWGAYDLPVHFFVDRDGVIRDGALGGAGADAFAAALAKILPGVTVTP